MGTVEECSIPLQVAASRESPPELRYQRARQSRYRSENSPSFHRDQPPQIPDYRVIKERQKQLGLGEDTPQQSKDKTKQTIHQQTTKQSCREDDRKTPSNIASWKYVDLSKLTDYWNMQPLKQGGRLLGRGGYATVFLAKQHRQKNMAVKRMENKDNACKQFFQEIDTLVKFGHPNIISLFGISDDGPNWCIIYEYMENGSLEDRLSCKDKKKTLTGPQRSKIIKGVAQGLNYLHTKNKPAFVHRDVKPANILLDSDFSAKVGDLGLAHRGPIDTTKTHTTTKNIIGTHSYCAPEYFRNEISVKLDAYSFGMVLYEVLTGIAVFDELREKSFLKEHVENTFEENGLSLGIHKLVDVRLSPGFKEENVAPVFDMARRLTALDKKQRPKIEEVLQEITEWAQEW